MKTAKKRFTSCGHVNNIITCKMISHSCCCYCRCVCVQCCPSRLRPIAVTLPLQIGPWPSVSSNYNNDSFLMSSESWFIGFREFIDSSPIYAIITLVPFGLKWKGRWQHDGQARIFLLTLLKFIPPTEACYENSCILHQYIKAYGVKESCFHRGLGLKLFSIQYHLNFRSRAIIHSCILRSLLSLMSFCFYVEVKEFQCIFM